MCAHCGYIHLRWSWNRLDSDDLRSQMTLILWRVVMLRATVDYGYTTLDTQTYREGGAR